MTARHSIFPASAANALWYKVIQLPSLMRRRISLPILMYHGICSGAAAPLQIPLHRLRWQFQHILRCGYTAISMSQLISRTYNHADLPKKPIVITFDDAYQSCADYLFPMLQEFGMKACIGLPVQYIGDCSRWDGDAALPIMNIDTIKQAPPQVEFLLHSYQHRNYRHSSLSFADADIAAAIDCLQKHAVNYAPVLVYPYGGFPRSSKEYSQFCSILKKHGILLALRIGNHINQIPIKDPYQIYRTDIKSADSKLIFHLKLLLGKLKPF